VSSPKIGQRKRIHHALTRPKRFITPGDTVSFTPYYVFRAAATCFSASRGWESAANNKTLSRLDKEDCRLVVAHLGGGITIGTHDHGRVVDATHGLNEGPLTPERAGGTLPVLPVLEWITALGGGSVSSARPRLIGDGGLQAYLGTKNGREVESLRCGTGGFQTRPSLPISFLSFFCTSQICRGDSRIVPTLLSLFDVFWQL
jgi:hypothetical protein